MSEFTIHPSSVNKYDDFDLVENVCDSSRSSCAGFLLLESPYYFEEIHDVSVDFDVHWSYSIDQNLPNRPCLPPNLLYSDLNSDMYLRQQVQVKFDENCVHCTFKFIVNLKQYRMIVTQSVCGRKLVPLKIMKHMLEYQEDREEPEDSSKFSAFRITNYPCKFNSYELARVLRLTAYDVLLTTEVEENIMTIFRELCEVNVAQAWMRSLERAERTFKLQRLMLYIKPWYPEFCYEQVEMLVKRGIYKTTQLIKRRARRKSASKRLFTNTVKELCHGM